MIQSATLNNQVLRYCIIFNFLIYVFIVLLYLARVFINCYDSTILCLIINILGEIFSLLKFLITLDINKNILKFLCYLRRSVIIWLKERYVKYIKDKIAKIDYMYGLY